MKRNTGTRIVSMLLAAQLPLSSVAQAAAPLTLSPREETGQPGSFREFIREEEWNTLRLNQTPMWQKLRLVTTGTSAEAPDEGMSENNEIPSTGGTDDSQQTPTGDNGTDDNQTPPVEGGDTDDSETPPDEGGDTDDSETPPDEGGDTDDSETLPDEGGNTDDNQTPPVEGGDTDDNQAPPDEGGDTDDNQTPPTEGGDTDDSETPPVEGGDTDDGETPPVEGGNTDDSETPPDEGGDADDNQTPPADDEDTDIVIPGEEEEATVDSSLEMAPFAAASASPPFFALLKMNGYGWEYATPGFGDSVWDETAKYNLEQEGHKWIFGEYHESATEFGSHGIMTHLYGMPNDPTRFWFDYSRTSEGYFIRDDIQALFDPADLPRLPNKEFAGWYVQESRRGEDYAPGMSYGIGSSGNNDKLPYEYNFSREGSVSEADENGPTGGRTTAREGDMNTRFDYKVNMEAYRTSAVNVQQQNLPNLLPVIGVWKDSTNATATDLKLYPSSTKANGDVTTYPGTQSVTVTKNRVETTRTGVVEFYDYSDSLFNLTEAELNERPTTTFDNNKTQYFIRVSNDTERLNFDFTTYEPGSTVVVTCRYGGASTDLTGSVTGVETTMSYDVNLVEGVYNEYAGRHPTNTPADDPNAADRLYEGTGPARKIFTLGTDTKPVYIDLGVYDASADNPSTTRNVITFTVTAPDGTTKKTYTVYVQRLAEPTMDKDPGNTPYGMIYREAAAVESKGDAWRDEAIARYNNNITTNAPSFFDGINFSSSVNNGGYVYQGWYRRAAWLPTPGSNLDEEPTALVVYSNASFQIPDATVTDALGNSHVASEYHVNWTLPLTIVDKLGPEVAYDAYPGNQRTLTGDTTSIVLPKNVKPGIYTLSYTYSDPYDAKDHSSEDNGFTRKIVVLPLPGDVDMDGAVTVADGIMLRTLIDSGAFAEMATSTDAVKRLYAYRVCNVNGDNSVDKSDVTLLLNSFATPAYGSTRESGAYYLYLPLPGGTAGSRGPAVKTEGHTGLTVKYLGMENEEGILDTSLAPDYDPDNITPFWMGVQLSDVSTLPESVTGNVTTFTFTLIYDPAYVEPWMPDGTTGLMDYILSQNPQWSGYTLLESSGSGIIPATHLESKARPNLTATENNLRELRFSIQGTGAALGQTLLKVPFRLRGYPTGLLDDQDRASLVDASLGPRDFTVTTSNGYGVWNNTAEATSTVTTNLATGLTYNGAEKVPLGANLAPGTTIRVHNSSGELVNPVYGDLLMDGNTAGVVLPDDGGINSSANHLLDESKLPPGLTYTPSTKTLTGTPTSAGTYSFTVQSGTGVNRVNFDFVITIDKAPLTLTVHDVTMYYGQQAYDTTPQTFTYDTTQIKANDLTGDKANTGTAEDLADLLSKEGDDYNVPQIILRTVKAQDGALVTSATVPGSYWVTLSGGASHNYRFYFLQPADGDSETEDRNDPDWGWATLTVEPRPIRVDQLTKDSLGVTIVSAASGLIEGNTVSFKENEFTTKTPAVTNLYGGIPLTTTTVVNNDELVLEYSVQVDNWPVQPTGPEEEFDATVMDVRLRKAKEGETSTDKNSCYVLVNLNDSKIEGHHREDGWVRPDTQTGKVTVKAREASKLESQWRDLIRDYTYGDEGGLNLASLEVKLTYKNVDGTDGEPEQIIGDMWLKGAPATGNVPNSGVIRQYENRGLTIQWVEHEGDTPAPVDPELVGTDAYDEYYPDMAYTGQHITVKSHNGKWLCITLQGSSQDRIYVGPFTVKKKTLTLQMSPISRYYGEENPTYDFQYNVDDLVSWDVTDPPPTNNNAGLKSNANITGYVEPTVSWRTAGTLTGGETVTSATGVGERYILLSGAKSDNYSFRYQTLDKDGNVTTTTAISLDPDSAAERANPIVGVSTLTIKPRPIMVTKINPPAGSLVYDALDNEVENVKATIVNTTGEDAKSGYTVELPQAGEHYYQKSGTSFVEYIKDGSLTGGPIRTGDSVTVQYTATYEPQDGRVQSPFWTLEDDETSRTVNVEIKDLVLTGDGQGGNYELIYAGGLPALDGYTAERDAGASAIEQAQWKRNNSTGNIVRRTITAIQVTHGPNRLSYRYGGLGSDDNGTLNLGGLQVKITYASGEPEFETYGTVVSGGEQTSTFAQKGLTVHWGTADGTEARSYDRLNVTDHNGKQLIITGQAVSTDPMITATLADGVSTTITVSKRPLVLTATDQERAYGEDNGVYEFTFETSDLAEWDAKLISDRNLSAKGSASALEKAATSDALTAIDSTFKGPIFDTDATKSSKVGDYKLYLDPDGAVMANYRFRLEPGTITVVKRPVYVDRILKNDPLHSVAEGATRTGHTSDCYVGKNAEGGTDADLTLSRDTRPDKPRTTGDPLIGDDRITVQVTLDYATTSMADGIATQRVNVTVTGLKLTTGGDNYSLDGSMGTVVGTEIVNGGEIHDKRIDEIAFFRTPNLAAYTYGDRLTLESIRIRYEGDTNFTVTSPVDNNFQLTAYYYDSPRVPTLETAEDWNAFLSELANCREASPGDHLTIAEDESGFAHNGKYILVLAKKSLEENSGYAQPIVAGPIRVAPKDLTYTLWAKDKVYDTTTAATGSITLTNVYQDPESGVWDQVYILGYNDSQPIPADFRFTSEDSGITFNFESPDVDEDIWVNASEIYLDGPDAANYDIGPARVTSSTSNTVSGRGGAPKADITKAHRPAMHEQHPDVKIDLSVDEHTNTVTVSANRPVSDFGNTLDQKNSQLHYEYQLVRLADDGTVIDTTEWQSSPCFGGELVEDGLCQDGDRDLGNRPAEARGRYLMANARLCETDNYYVSAPTASTNDPAGAIRAARTAWEAAVSAEADPQNKERIVERTPGPVVRTYTYRVDLYDSAEVKAGEQITYDTTLVAVWFTDIAQHRDQQSFERLTDNLETPLYTGYFWDPGRKVALTFGESFDMSTDMTVRVPMEQDGATQEQDVVVNPGTPNGGRNMTVYVTTIPREDTSPSIKKLTIIPEELIGRVGDAPVQLELIVVPKKASLRNLSWTSSDPSVATVDRKGVVTFVGPGTAVITVRTRNGVTASMVVRVQGNSLYDGTMFNPDYEGAYMDVDTAGAFGPEETMTRGTMVTIMARFFQMVDTVRPKEHANMYDDVSGSPSYLDQLNLLDCWGIINGIGENRFAPEDKATRAEVAVVLCQMLMLPVGTDPNAPHAFTDATPENHWAWAYIDALAAAGITVGTGGGRYSPDDPVTRAELATFIANILTTRANIEAPDLVIPVDVPKDHWAYLPVLRAVNSGAMLLLKEWTY